ncbi:MAG: tetratricopeptide repeat protein [Gemmatimonadaceae bacterium]
MNSRPVRPQAPKALPRPRVGAVADTNDARAYLNYGLDQFERNPSDAASAFYWASRIDPTLGEAFYGYRSAEIMRMPNLRREYFTGNDNNPSKDMRRLDSLYLRAVIASPFLYRRLDRPMFTQWWRESIERNLRENGVNINDVSPGEITHYIERAMQAADQGTRAWTAYSDGDFDLALKRYADAVKATKEKSSYRIMRGRIFGMRGDVDSAVSEFKLAIEELKRRDEKKVVVLYNSRAVLEHSIAVLLEGRGDNSGAREAYGRALQEDLSYWPAHLRLGLLSLTEKDTTAALAELDLAVQVAPKEPWVREMYGVTLSYAGRSADALAQLRAAVDLEPYWAQPNATIGQLLEKENPSGAIEAYQRYLARATRNAPMRSEIEARLGALTKRGPD